MWTEQTIMATADGDDLHYVFRNNPLELMSYVDKRVELRTFDGSLHHGYVYTVDPVTGSYVLHRADKEDNLSVEIVPGTAILAAKVLELESADELDIRPISVDRLERLLGTSSNDHGRRETPIDYVARKRTVSAWLRRHLIPVTDGVDDPGTLTIMNALTIKPPYTPNDCCSQNEIILGKVVGLLKSMPQNWNENDLSQ